MCFRKILTLILHNCCKFCNGSKGHKCDIVQYIYLTEIYRKAIVMKLKYGFCGGVNICPKSSKP